MSRSFITLSRQTGAGGITIGRILTEILQKHYRADSGLPPWDVLDKNLIASDKNLQARLQHHSDGFRHTDSQRMLDVLFGAHREELTHIKKVSETMIRLADIGHVILVGRGANILTRNLAGGFHVRLVGSYPKRLKHIQNYYGLTRDQADHKIKEEDQARKNYLRKYFEKDIDDPLLYDVVLNTDYFSYEDAARLISHAVIRLENMMDMLETKASLGQS